MATEYGYRRANGQEVWEVSRKFAESLSRNPGYTLIAREVSEPRIVSIRA